MTSTSLACRVGALALDNPLLTASGTYGSGSEYEDFEDVARLGGLVSKSVTLRPTPGNPPPRIAETPAGMLNAIGLQNEGVDYFLAELLPAMRARKKAKDRQKIIVNCAGHAEADYLGLVERLADAPVDALEINISCPNVKAGGMTFGTDARVAGPLIRRLRDATPPDRPLWVKLTPQAGDFTGVARAVVDAGADALTVSNTFLGMAIDIDRRRPVLANGTGGLSGPCVHPLVLRLVWETRRALPDVPIVAVGGVWTVRDVVDFLMAGAQAVQVGTANLVRPGTATRLIDDLADWLVRKNASLSEIINGAHPP